MKQQTTHVQTSGMHEGAKQYPGIFNLNAQSSVNADAEHEGGGATTAAPKKRTAPPRVEKMPPWKVLLHNDHKNDMGYVVDTILELMTISPQIALVKMLEAHKTGVALLVTAHREYAELLQEQFKSKGLTVTIEPDR